MTCHNFWWLGILLIVSFGNQWKNLNLLKYTLLEYDLIYNELGTWIKENFNLDSNLSILDLGSHLEVSKNTSELRIILIRVRRPCSVLWFKPGLITWKTRASLTFYCSWSLSFNFEKLLTTWREMKVTEIIGGKGTFRWCLMLFFNSFRAERGKEEKNKIALYNYNWDFYW